jgi:hypothetical protein
MWLLGCAIVVSDDDAQLTSLLTSRLNLGPTETHPRETRPGEAQDVRSPKWRLRIRPEGAVPVDLQRVASCVEADARGVRYLEGWSVGWVVGANCAARVTVHHVSEATDARISSLGSPGDPSFDVSVDVFGDPSDDPLPILLAIGEGVSARPIIPLHAAILTQSLRSIAVLGPSGAGKTTSAVLAALDGWQIIAEDTAWLDPETLEVVGSDRQLRLRPGTELLVDAALARRNIDVAHEPHDGVKRLLRFDAIGGRGNGAHLDEVVVLGPRDSPWLAGPLRPAQVAIALHQAAGIPIIESVRPLRAAAIASVAQRVSGRRISASSGKSGL